MKLGIFIGRRSQDKMDKDKDASAVDATTITTTQQAAEPQTPKGVKVLKISKLEPKLPEKVVDDVEAAKKPSKFRQLLPILLFVITFATVLSLLIIYLDTSTEYRHEQFRLNMTRDYDLMNINQDNPSLVSYVRDIHMKKYPMAFLEKMPLEQYNYTNSHELAPVMGKYIAENLLNNKQEGVFFQSLTGSNGEMMTAPWFTEQLRWGGTIVEPDPRKYFNYRRHYVHRDNIQIIHACLSPHQYPKEVTLHDEDESDVKIDQLNEESSWFHSRVKCFPLYTLLLAINTTKIDVLSLGCQGQEMEIMQTLPLDRVQISVITIHLVHIQHKDDLNRYLPQLIQFMQQKSYKLVKSFDKNYIFQSMALPVSRN